LSTTRIRGATLSDVIDALRDVWHTDPARVAPGVLATVPAVGEQ
jgi:hypothetical protein